MSWLRPRNALAATGAYFAIVVYLAWETARATTAVWYDEAISQIVYQTSMVGGILLIAGLFVIASMHPRMPTAARSKDSASRSRRRLRAGGHELPDPSDTAVQEADDASYADVNAFLANLLEVPAHGGGPVVRVDAPMVTADFPDSSSPHEVAPLEGATAGGRARGSAGALYNEGDGDTRILSDYVAGSRKLLVDARHAGLSGRDIWKALGEPEVQREADVAARVRLAEHAKESLEAALVQRIWDDLENVLAEVQSVKANSERAHAAELIVAEAITLLDTGNFSVAIDRGRRARETLETRSVPTPPARHATPTSWVALAGPTIAAVAYVTASSMLLPGIGGFLTAHYQLNTTAILALSYGWVGLLVYAIVSAYMTLGSASNEPRGRATLRL